MSVQFWPRAPERFYNKLIYDIVMPMEPEMKQKIDELFELTKENNKILRKMRSSQKWASITRLFYWLVIIGISIGAYYYVEPYLKQVLSLYSQSKATLDKVQNLGNSLPDVSNINGILDQFKK